jgi:hypothetical protein
LTSTAAVACEANAAAAAVARTVDPTLLLGSAVVTPAAAVAVVQTRIGAVYIVSQIVDGIVRRVVFPASARRIVFPASLRRSDFPPSVRRILFPES